MKQDIISHLFEIEERLYYKKLDNGKYRIFCSQCQKYETISKNQMQQVITAKVCPICFRRVRTSRKLSLRTYDYIEDDHKGYLINMFWEFGNKPKVKTQLVAKWSEDYREVDTRYICLYMYSLLYRPDDPRNKKWKHRKTGYSYLNHFNDLRKYQNKVRSDGMFESVWNMNYPHKKSYYSHMITQIGVDECDIKSNQKKIMMDSILNKTQIIFLLMFDLKSYQDLYKYRKYIDSHDHTFKSFMSWSTPEPYYIKGKNLNVYYLDYLARNNIKLSDYYDYMNQCDTLELKYDKPKDFKVSHDKLGKIIVNKNNEALNKLIVKVSKRNQKYSFISNNYTIKPIGDAQECIEVSDKMHNCIASCYMEDYAKGKTNLFVLQEGNEYIVAIEIKKNRLEQARLSYNDDLDKKNKKRIDNWVKLNNFSYT